MTDNTWVEAINEISGKGEAYVLITILGVRGSSPRDSGTKMVVTGDHTYATIGGGHLEYKVIQMARQMLIDASQDQKLEHFPLGPALGQCCGGSVSILFERFAARSVSIMLFGAGHVGSALVQILSALPLSLTWVDSRADFLPQNLSGNIKSVCSDRPGDEVATMPADAYYIIMTHSHQIDFELLDVILKRGDYRYVGLIGSQTKWRRFQQRLEFRGHSKTSIQAIRCPIGLSSIPGKQPMEVAVSIAADIIQDYHAHLAVPGTQQGITWQALQSVATEGHAP